MIEYINEVTIVTKKGNAGTFKGVGTGKTLADLEKDKKKADKKLNDRLYGK